MHRVAIVGGGPGGLVTARLLEETYGPACDVTLYEASDRVGGKAWTRTFSAAPVAYEAGLAECYDYEHLGRDPLKELLRDLGLETQPLAGGSVFVRGRDIRDDETLEKALGVEARRALEDFRSRAVASLPQRVWYEGRAEDGERHPWAQRSWESVLAEIPSAGARAYLRAACHSDLAAEPSLVSGLTGLENFLLDVPGYARHSAIRGGMERLTRALRARLRETSVVLSCPVRRIERSPRGTYRLHATRGGRAASEEFDAVVVALPHNALHAIAWEGDLLDRVMARHVAAYDRPGHYLRVSVLFRSPFWRRCIEGDWFMLDAFGGACVYDEGRRHVGQDLGVLGWLLAGSHALAACNAEADVLLDAVLASLPGGLPAEARSAFIEARIHRWAGAVSAGPGPRIARGTRAGAAQSLPGFFLVGDYLHDSTLNGVVEAAGTAADLVRAEIAGAPLPRSRGISRRA